MPLGRLPGSSYRLQFNGRFTFDQARTVVPYLDALGITECYTSPLLQSKPGSEHGYDIVDHDALDPALGSLSDFEALTAALESRDMGLLVDFVPNHMGLDPVANRWWRDVLEYGRDSPYADYFDIDWDPVAPELKGRILLPILQSGYGDVLERGDLSLAFSAGSIAVRHGDTQLPIAPRSIPAVLRMKLDRLLSTLPADDAGAREYMAIVRLLEQQLPETPAARAENRRIGEECKVRLAQLTCRSPAIRQHVETTVAAFDGVPGKPATFDALHELLDAQVYRLAHWKTAFDEINYRRFFDVNDLGAIRMEDEQVFDAAHRLVLRLVERGLISGLRLDHPDGLLDPAAYFDRLQRAVARVSRPNGHGESPHRPFYLLAEKILAADEHLPEDWRVAGTTGYGFLNGVNGLFVDRSNRQAIERLYARLTGHRRPFVEEAYQAKRLIMTSSMASELGVLTRALKRIAESHRSTRDYTLNALRRTLIEIVACLGVYRTYVSAAGFSARDREVIDFAVDQARRRNPVMASSLFLFVRNVLLSEASSSPDGGTSDQDMRRTFAMKFQQFSAPVQAKGVEDTAFYRDNALVSLNEVGGQPERFGSSPDEFHAANRVRLERWPLEMTASSTHDTKRGEDARARIDVISELTREWRQAVRQWIAVNAPRRTVVEREPAPDRSDEYLFYQSLLGTWPAECAAAPVPAEAPPDLVARMRQFMQKAVKEAKVHSSWVNQNTPYEDAVVRFVEGTLSGPGASAFLASFVPFARRIALCGMVNSLAQLVLKLAAPGVPDFYQGSEDWHLVLADPDNRRAVDFARRHLILNRLMPWVQAAEARRRGGRALAAGAPDDLEHHVRSLLEGWEDGRIKTFVTACGLRLRREERQLLVHGRYQPVMADGTGAGQVAGFVRSLDDRAIVAVVPRLMSSSVDRAIGPPFIPGKAWGDTRIGLPPEMTSRQLVHVFTGVSVTTIDDAGGVWLNASELFRTSPVALLWVR